MMMMVRFVSLLTLLFAAMFGKSSADLVEIGTLTSVGFGSEYSDPSPTACLDEGGCTPHYTRDGNLDDRSRWSCRPGLTGGKQCSIEFWFAGGPPIAVIAVKFYKGTERTRKVKLTGYGAGVEEWYFESRTETGDDFEYWYLNTSGTHTMFIESVDLTDNEWLSLVEVKFMVCDSWTE